MANPGGRAGALWLTAAAGAAGMAFAAERRRIVRRAPKELRSPAAYLPLEYNAATLPWLRRATSVTSRLAPPAPVRGVSTRATTIPREDDAPGVDVLISERPDRPKGSAALLWIHGGGFVAGRAADTTALCRARAKDLNVLVVSVDYRLAPEHPFPAGLDDSFAALAWLHAHASELRIDPHRIAVGGDSAGGGLAACLAQRAHDGGLEVAFQLLVYPMLDDRTCLSAPPPGVGELVWTPASNRFGWTSYLGQEPGGQAPPYAVAARRADLAGLPPAWIGVGTTDLFCAEDVEYAHRLTEAGVAVTTEIVPDLFHGADAVAPKAPQSAAFREAQDAALRDALGLPR